jgi:hypothetical protein
LTAYIWARVRDEQVDGPQLRLDAVDQRGGRAGFGEVGAAGSLDFDGTMIAGSLPRRLRLAWA